MKHRDYITISKIIEELTIAEDLIEHTTQQEFENREKHVRINEDKNFKWNTIGGGAEERLRHQYY